MDAEQDKQDHEARDPETHRDPTLPEPSRAKPARKKEKRQAHHDATPPSEQGPAPERAGPQLISIR
jgi:hypothetical protein